MLFFIKDLIFVIVIRKKINLTNFPSKYFVLRHKMKSSMVAWLIEIGKTQKEELFFREITSMSHKYAAHVDFSQSELATFKE